MTLRAEADRRAAPPTRSSRGRAAQTLVDLERLADARAMVDRGSSDEYGS